MPAVVVGNRTNIVKKGVGESESMTLPIPMKLVLSIEFADTHRKIIFFGAGLGRIFRASFYL